MRGVQCGTLYTLLGSTVFDECNISIVFESKNEERKVSNVSWRETMLWYQRFGHIGKKGLQSLQGKRMVESMSTCNLDFDFCKHYLYDKRNRVNSLWCYKRKRDREVNTQWCVWSYTRYIDNFSKVSRGTWLYFLKKKSKVLSKFKKFKAFVKTRT